MKKIKLYKTFNLEGRNGYGTWSWNTERSNSRFDRTEYQPYEVEISEEFHLGRTNSNELMIFREGEKQACHLVISKNDESGEPLLITGDRQPMKLKVLGEIEE